MLPMIKFFFSYIIVVSVQNLLLQTLFCMLVKLYRMYFIFDMHKYVFALQNSQYRCVIHISMFGYLPVFNYINLFLQSFLHTKKKS